MRFGFANDSSSSHSIIIVPSEEYTNLRSKNTKEYGWWNFTLKNKTNKNNYLSALLYECLKQSMTEETLQMYIEALGIPYFLKDEAFCADHDSVWSIPVNYKG